MKLIKALTLIISFSILVSPLILLGLRASAANSIYFSVEPVAIPPLMDTNSSINGLEMPATPSPVGQNFTVQIHLIGASSANVSGVEVDFYFGSILTYAVPTGFTDALGTTGGVLTQNTLLYGISAGFYDNFSNSISDPPYTGATYYKVAAASTGKPWSGTDGLVANVTFQIIKQPLGSNGETTVSLPLAIDFTDLVDPLTNPISHDVVQGTLTIDATPATPVTQYSLSVNVVGNGTVTQNPLNTTYASGTNITLTAVPGTGWTFQGWSGDETRTLNPVNITMNGNKTVTATFVQVSLANYSLIVNVVGNGTVTQNPFNATYASGTVVTLAAVPATDWSFSGWSGDMTGVQNPLNVTMDGNKTVTATFTQPGQYYSLTVNVVGNGTVTQNPFNNTYLNGTVVTLTAVPGFDWAFTSWTGDLTGVQNPANITMDGNKTVTATFTQYYSPPVNVVFLFVIIIISISARAITLIIIILWILRLIFG
jgi:uncharacterized repeat protein (TIGR02543 family)